jgi:hypothetical protein
MKPIAKSVSMLATTLALLASVAATHAQPYGPGRAAKALTPEVKQALVEALAGPEGEFAAHALYSVVLEKYGKIEPYAAIREAEKRHIQALKRQLQKYGISIPEDRFTGKVSGPASLLEAAKQSVESEEKNIAMYDRYLSTVKGYPDLTRVFTNLQRASRDAHLPAFKVAVESAGKLNAPSMATAMKQCPQSHDKAFCQEFCWPETAHGKRRAAE